MNSYQRAAVALTYCALKALLIAQTNTFPSSGNVGIGTSGPSTPLQVVGPITAGASAGSTLGVDYLYGHYSDGKLFVIGSQHSSAASFMGFGVKAKPGATGYLSSTGITIGRSAFEADSGFLAFLTGASQVSTDGGATELAERMRINAMGNVGIGTTNPSAKLHINSGDQAIAAILATNVEAGELRIRSFSTQPANVPSFGIVHSFYSDENNGFFKFWRGTSVNNGFVTIGSSGEERLRIDPVGNVGIGTTNPTVRLDIVGGPVRTDSYGYTSNNVSGTGSAAYFPAEIFTPGGTSWIYGHTYIGGAPSNGSGHEFFQNGTAYLGMGGNIGIGTTNPTQKLSVNGTVRAKEVIVDTGWSDYVFDSDYRLAPLSEVETHIKAHHHLPGIPSATEVAVNGISIGDMQARLLAKIEELTLRQIAQEKEINALKGGQKSIQP